VGARTQESGPPALSSPRNPGVQAQPLLLKESRSSKPQPLFSQALIFRHQPCFLRPRSSEVSSPPSDPGVQALVLLNQTQWSRPQPPPSDPGVQTPALLPQTQRFRPQLSSFRPRGPDLSPPPSDPEVQSGTSLPERGRA
jgi:hypothetical protein